MEITATMMAGCVISDDEGRLLVLRRGEEGDTVRWEPPGGKADPGEEDEPHKTAAREAKEELGLEVRLGPSLAQAAFILDDRPFHYEFFAAQIAPGQGSFNLEETYSAAEYKTPQELRSLASAGKLSAFVLYILENNLLEKHTPDEHAA